jgi:hypothetical protein
MRGWLREATGGDIADGWAGAGDGMDGGGDHIDARLVGAERGLRTAAGQRQQRRRDCALKLVSTVGEL